VNYNSLEQWKCQRKSHAQRRKTHTWTWNRKGRSAMANTHSDAGGGGEAADEGSRWFWRWQWLGSSMTADVSSSSSPLQRRCFFSWFPLFPLSTMFFLLCSGFVEVLVVAAWGVAWAVVGLSSFSSLRFSSALFSSVSLFSFCFSRCCCLLGGRWQLEMMLGAVERKPTIPHGG